MQAHLGLHLPWPWRKSRCHECSNAKGDRTVADTPLPILNVRMKAFPRIFDLPVKLFGSFHCPLAMPFENGYGQARLCRKVMMDAWLLYLYRLCDFSITKGRISSLDHEGFCCFQNAFCHFTLHID